MRFARRCRPATCHASSPLTNHARNPATFPRFALPAVADLAMVGLGSAPARECYREKLYKTAT